MKLQVLPSKNCSDPHAVAARAADAASGWLTAHPEAIPKLAPLLQTLSGTQKKKK